MATTQMIKKELVGITAVALLNFELGGACSTNDARDTGCAQSGPGRCETGRET
ncbi:hypothetical protein [Amycolatopsis sp. NPDC059657]|uniref:hypothetical protein n=1 Tax=Amycolatopsis sp. NPDC059657 TaxID=3346899 RepID=UPI00366D60BC